MSTTDAHLQARLDRYYHQIEAVILSRQNPVTGLLPASTAINAHGDYTDAWVRDNVYSILAVWGLAIAYRKFDEKHFRTFELEHSLVKLMRGLMFCMMRQADKVERFKQTQSRFDCLHAKYDTYKGDVVVGDYEWGHLQLDATSLFLLMLAQMTASGFHIIYSVDEVHFIQNLVYYIGRTYRTPDYGIWERGNKTNSGYPELNASSVAIAKAALEAMNGLDLFGDRGGEGTTTIYVLPDEIARARMTLESLLPRESASKEIDAALLSAIGFPAFAVESRELIDRTRYEIVDKLKGRYGCKRFLRDGHQTVLEDTNRLYYQPGELKQFEHIECEWPLFFAYLVLDGLFNNNPQQVKYYQQCLDGLVIERDGMRLLPELYYVPADKVEAEKRHPQSQQRLPNENIPLVWAQSLYYLGQMLQDGLISIDEIDPLGRHKRIGQKYEPLVQVALLAEDEDLQRRLSAEAIVTQTPKQVWPIEVRQAGDLSAIYHQIGRNDKLGLTGRPVRRLRSLTTSRIFRMGEKLLVFLPSFLDLHEFYLTLDYHFLVAQIKTELAYIHRHWAEEGNPIVTLLVTKSMLDSAPEVLLDLMQELKSSECNGVPVKLVHLNQWMVSVGTERIDFLKDFNFSHSPVRDAAPDCYYLPFHPDRNWPLSHTQEFLLECETNLDLLIESLRTSENLYEQIELLHALTTLKGLDFDTEIAGSDRPVTVADLLEEVYFKACRIQESNGEPMWAAARAAAGLLKKVDVGLSDAVTEILARQKQIVVGHSFSEGSLIAHPMSHGEIMEKICQFCREDVRDRSLSQEILIYLGLLIKSEPQIFHNLLTLRVGYLILLITSEIAYEMGVTLDLAYEHLMHSSPFEVKTRLRQVLSGYEGMNQRLRQQESIHVRQREQDIDWVVMPLEDDRLPLPEESWYRHRQVEGARGRVPDGFFHRVWNLLKHCKGLAIGDKLERRNRLDSELILADMTQGENNFALKVDHLLSKLDPEYRQLNIEALAELAALVERNPNMQIEEYIILEILIAQAVRISFLERYPDKQDKYDDFKAAAWRIFYNLSPSESAGYFVKSFRYLSEFGQQAIAA